MRIAIADAKMRFAEIIRRAEAGEEIEVTRYGRAVARIVGPADIHAGDAEVAALFAQGGIAPGTGPRLP